MQIQLKLFNSKLIGPEEILPSYPKFELNMGQLFMTIFKALKSDFQRPGQLFALQYVDTLYSRFSAIWRRFKHEIYNRYETVFIYCIIIVETQQNF